MADRLVLHIGHYKTGTTALQVFLARNAQALRAAGLEYPEARRHNAKHSDYAFALLRAAGARRLMHGYADPTPPETLWEALFARVRASPAATVIVSSEEFMRLAMFPAAETRLSAILERHAAGLRVEALAYLRAPQSHLRSWYNQLVKMHEPTPDYARALAGTIEPIHLDYGLALGPWRRLLGDGGVILRPYRPRSLDPLALFGDVLATLGVAVPARVNLPEKDPNPRLDDRLVEMLRLLRNTGLRGERLKALHDSAAKYLAEQDALAADGRDGGQAGVPDTRPEPGRDMAGLRQRAAAGIAALRGMPRSGLDLEAFHADLPREVPSDRTLPPEVLGFVLAELVRLSRRLDRHDISALERRMDRLEALLAPAPGTAAQAPSGPAPGPAGTRTR